MHLFPLFSPPPPPQASCQLLCVEIYIMRVEYRNVSVSTIKQNDVIRALKQKSYHIVLAQLFEAPNNAIQRINRYPADKRQRSALCYASDSDLSSGYRYPPFDQPRSARLPWGHHFFLWILEWRNLSLLCFRIECRSSGCAVGLSGVWFREFRWYTGVVFATSTK